MTRILQPISSSWIDYPDNESEILKVANYYFNDLNGDWYMTELFTKWCDGRGIDVNKIVNIRK